jgi:hypothetical protein
MSQVIDYIMSLSYAPAPAPACVVSPGNPPWVKEPPPPIPTGRCGCPSTTKRMCPKNGFECECCSLCAASGSNC